MPELQYKGKTVVVANEETTEADWIIDIPSRDLFISNANKRGKRFAFSLIEIENYVKEHGLLINFYNIPRSAFSVSEMKELIQRSTFIAQFIAQYIDQSQVYASLISEETLQQMESLVKHCSHIIDDPRVLKAIKQKYTEEELEELQENGISIHDLGRGLAFQQFKTYYQALSAKEQHAIDHFPGVAQQFQQYGLKDSLRTIFNLHSDACLGGSAGVCREIIERIQLFRLAKEAFTSNTTEEIMDSESEVTIRYLNP